MNFIVFLVPQSLNLEIVKEILTPSLPRALILPKLVYPLIFYL